MDTSTPNPQPPPPPPLGEPPKDADSAHHETQGQTSPRVESRRGTQQLHRPPQPPTHRGSDAAHISARLLQAPTTRGAPFQGLGPPGLHTGRRISRRRPTGSFLRSHHELHHLHPSPPHHHPRQSLSPSASSHSHSHHSHKPLPTTMTASERRKTMSRLTFSLSQLTNVLRQEKSLENLPEGMKESGIRRLCTNVAFSSLASMSDNKIVEEGQEETLGVPMDKGLKDFHKDYFRRMEEAARKRRSLKCRKRWHKGYRKVQSMLRISRNMAQRSKALEVEPSTYVDIGDSVTVTVDYGAGRSIDVNMFKRKEEISISSQVSDTLTSCPEDRTLLQLEEARRELQKVQVFSEYPIDVQEHILRRAFYITIGPQRVILRQGHHPHSYFIIICGEAYVKEKVWDEERKKTVAKASSFLKTGDTFGSYALIHDVNRHNAVISRTNMQLLAINGEDFLEFIVRRSSSDKLPPHIQYLSEMSFMENFPIHLLKEKLNACVMHHFRRNAVITGDSEKCRSLFIVKYGYCKVFRRLQSRDHFELYHEEMSMSQNKKEKEESGNSMVTSDPIPAQQYIERDSPHVSYMEMQSPLGKTVRLPVTKVPGRADKLRNTPLSLPKERRQFVPLMLLREGEVFGLDQTVMCPSRDKSRSTILVSLGAEVIALNKDFYCRHAAREAAEVAEKTFIYDDKFIRRRVRERVNRDVHLEEVLRHHFLKVDHGVSSVKVASHMEFKV